MSRASPLSMDTTSTARNPLSVSMSMHSTAAPFGGSVCESLRFDTWQKARRPSDNRMKPNPRSATSVSITPSASSSDDARIRSMSSTSRRTSVANRPRGTVVVVNNTRWPRAREKAVAGCRRDFRCTSMRLPSAMGISGAICPYPFRWSYASIVPEIASFIFAGVSGGQPDSRPIGRRCGTEQVCDLSLASAHCTFARARLGTTGPASRKRHPRPPAVRGDASIGLGRCTVRNEAVSHSHHRARSGTPPPQPIRKLESSVHKPGRPRVDAPRCDGPRGRLLVGALIDGYGPGIFYCGLIGGLGSWVLQLSRRLKELEATREPAATSTGPYTQPDPATDDPEPTPASISTVAADISTDTPAASGPT